MKNYLFILGLVGTALFTACSTADDLISEDPNGTPPDDQATETALIAEASQNSDVSIALVAGQSRGYTRAPIDPTDVVDGYGKFHTEDGRYLGVFCLATGKQTGVSYIPSSIKNCDWKESADDDLVVRLCNVPAKVSADGKITFMDPDELFDVSPEEKAHYWYYPMASWLRYNFYAYYPRQDDVDDEGHQTLSFTSNQAVEKYYTIDGSQDIIWGRSYPWNPETSEEATGHDPYCAKYFRWREENLEAGKTIADYFPVIKFEHKLVLFNFSVKANDAAVTAAGAKVTDMYISNAIYKLSLVVANKKDTLTNHQNGKLGYIKRDGGKLPQMTRLDIKETSSIYNNRFDGTDAKAMDVTALTEENAQEVGYLMLPSPKVAEDILPDLKYRLVINFVYAGQPNVADIEMDPPLKPKENPNDPDEYGFEEGKKYSILVNIKSPLEISAKAVLQEWDDSPAPITYNSDNSGS